MDPQTMQMMLLTNATSTMVASIVLLLEEKNLVSSSEYADLLDQSAKSLEDDHSVKMPGIFPIDAALMRLTARSLRANRNRGWKPTVIEGGASGNNATDRGG
jgi:hypothetical protein